MEFNFGWEMLLLFFAAAALAGFIDSIAGGGGLIGIPVLLLSGLPPINALATNKVQGMAGSFTASMTMIKKGVVDFKKIWFAALMSFIGATLGTICVHYIDVSVLDILVPIVLIMIGLYFLLVPNIGDVEKKPRMQEKVFNTTVVPGIGFYDGIFGPGTGSFFSLSNIALRGQQIITATGNAKVFNFASNIAAVVVFVVSGKVVWLVGGVMIIGQILGAYLGSLMVIKNGSKLIRPLVVVMCFLMVARYLYGKF
ncbi:TSUP family transporter [Pelistega suis]|uniref:TSUP family transporter n=1 Tax=Pelistega suis TaxID=1631957 RepID=UPI00211C936B|nr:TSUP family transporter [Pelistega suis]MCQ9328863.1 TSUP family transporter [Pelistega suis]